MSLNFYGNIGTTYKGIVTGAELEKVSQEIFGGAQVKAGEKINQPQQVQQQQTVQPRPASEINLYNRNTDLQLTQQVAQTRVDYNVQLSPQALQNIDALKTLAATQQMNTHKLNEGKIFIPVDNSQPSDVQTAFALPHATSVLNAFSMDKDRKGSNPFAYTQPTSKEDDDNSNGGISILA